MAKVKLVLACKSEIFREGLVRLLEHEPSIEVVCACRTGLEAVESAREHQPDVVLIGSSLSECSGIEAAQCINEVLPKTGIIMLTNIEADATFLSAIKAGVRAYISGNVDVENLIKYITLVAEGDVGDVIISPLMATRLLEEFDSLEERENVVDFTGVYHLTKREQAVLAKVAQGFTNREIATTLFISEHTVKVHLRNIMEKLHAHTRQQAVALGLPPKK